MAQVEETLYRQVDAGGVKVWKFECPECGKVITSSASGNGQIDMWVNEHIARHERLKTKFSDVDLETASFPKLYAIKRSKYASEKVKTKIDRILKKRSEIEK